MKLIYSYYVSTSYQSLKLITMATATSESSISNTSVSRLLLKEKPPTPYNPWWMVTSFLLVVVISVFLYVVPTWYIAEVLTRDIVTFLLNLTGVQSYPTEVKNIVFPFSAEWAQFGEASINTPGVVIPNSEYDAFWIVKACTGMQAGGILIALIFVTPLPLKGKLSDPETRIGQLNIRERLRLQHPTFYSFLHKSTVAVMFYFILFFTNAVRIWFHLYLVGAFQLPFSFAHDDLSKPIGFVGTLIFAWIIEKSGIPIIDTFADWLDALYYGVKGIINKF